MTRETYAPMRLPRTVEIVEALAGNLLNLLERQRLSSRDVNYLKNYVGIDHRQLICTINTYTRSMSD